MKPRPRRSRRIRQLTLLLGLCLVAYCLIFISTPPKLSHDDGRPKEDLARKPDQWLSPDVLDNLFLDERQCAATFPGLMKEIDDTVAKGPFKVKHTSARGPLQGRIKDGKVRISMSSTWKVCPQLTYYLTRKLFIIHTQRKTELSQEMINVSIYLR